MTKSVYSQRGKSGDKSIKRHTKRCQEVKKQFHIFKKKHQNRANIRKRQKIESSNAQTNQKTQKTAQTCQKSRER